MGKVTNGSSHSHARFVLIGSWTVWTHSKTSHELSWTNFLFHESSGPHEQAHFSTYFIKFYLKKLFLADFVKVKKKMKKESAHGRFGSARDTHWPESRAGIWTRTKLDYFKSQVSLIRLNPPNVEAQEDWILDKRSITNVLDHFDTSIRTTSTFPI